MALQVLQMADKFTQKKKIPSPKYTCYKWRTMASSENDFILEEAENELINNSDDAKCHHPNC
jgi:hypothetical protein